MQTLQIVPADGATDGLQVASVGDKPSQGLAVGGKSCFQISDGENLGGCRHEQNDQDVLTFGLDRSFRLLPPRAPGPLLSLPSFSSSTLTVTLSAEL